MPRDRATRIPRAVRKATKPQSEAIQQAIDTIGALPGLADVGVTKRLPKGFTEAVRALHKAHDEYIEVAAAGMALESAARPGTPEGAPCCREMPLGVTGVEGAVIYRTIRVWKDFPQVAARLAELGQAQFDEIQSLHKGKDLQKIRMNDKAVREGRLAFARKGEACPFLDEERGRCRIWEVRPQSCRMHHVTTNPEWSDARSEHFEQVEAKNLRIPVRQQVALMQVEKRMMLQAAPFMHANVVQIAQMTEGDQLYEVGEAPLKFQQDGQIQQRANRNKAGAKKFKGKGKGKGKGKSRKK